MLEQATTMAEPRFRNAVLPAWPVLLATSLVAIAAVTPVVLSAPAGLRGAALPVFVVGVVLLFGLGVSDLAREWDSRFARAVVVSGVLWALSALAVSTTPALYSVGRVAEWLVDVAIVYLLVSYPSG